MRLDPTTEAARELGGRQPEPATVFLPHAVGVRWAATGSGLSPASPGGHLISAEASQHPPRAGAAGRDVTALVLRRHLPLWTSVVRSWLQASEPAEDCRRSIRTARNREFRWTGLVGDKPQHKKQHEQRGNLARLAERPSNGSSSSAAVRVGGHVGSGTLVRSSGTAEVPRSRRRGLQIGILDRDAPGVQVEQQVVGLQAHRERTNGVGAVPGRVDRMTIGWGPWPRPASCPDRADRQQENSLRPRLAPV
jgi:hypothetical protein